MEIKTNSAIIKTFCMHGYWTRWNFLLYKYRISFVTLCGYIWDKCLVYARARISNMVFFEA